MRIFDLVIAAAVVALIGVALWVFVLGGLSGESPALVSQPPASQAGLTPTSVAGNRLDCDAIRGTNYLSSEERTWFLDNCTGPSADQASPPPSPPTLSADQPTPAPQVVPSGDSTPPPPPPTPLPPPPEEPSDTPPSPPAKSAPTATAHAPAGPIEYVGTHSAGGTIRFSLTAEGDRKVASFVAHHLCGQSFGDRILNLTNLRIIGFGFGHTDIRFLVTGVFSSNGEASGRISYYANDCRNEVTWTASIEGSCPVLERYNEILC